MAMFGRHSTCSLSSVLHNPHLGLSQTLHKLYEYAKNMADCVVPQEYGTTTEEKRSVGVKICKGLLDKIMYDLSVARTDNEGTSTSSHSFSMSQSSRFPLLLVDMRYMINMDYSADLPINTMGRRIRTRLYFTSESHLHTVLNALRFAGDKEPNPLLSGRGVEIINSTPELCYLTQIVMRVFEDSRFPMEDPRRFRVEILFSPGANATPFHLQANVRETDTTRFDTAGLEMIGREGLTCAEVESFFEQVIVAGRSADDEDFELASTSSAAGVRGTKKNREAPVVTETDKISAFADSETLGSESPAAGDNETLGSLKDNLTSTLDNTPYDSRKEEMASAENTASPRVVETSSSPTDECAPPRAYDEAARLVDAEKETLTSDRSLEPQADSPGTSNVVVRKVFWSAISVGSIALGVGCLYMAMTLGERRPRRWSTRR